MRSQLFRGREEAVNLLMPPANSQATVKPPAKPMASAPKSVSMFSPFFSGQGSRRQEAGKPAACVLSPASYL
jgi:hypothetical protein